MSRLLRTLLPSLLLVSGCVLPGDFGDFTEAPSGKDGGNNGQTNGGEGGASSGKPDSGPGKTDGGNGGMDGGTGGDAGMDAMVVDLLCMMAGCDPAATCDSSSGVAVCACPDGYLDFGVIDPDNPQLPGRVCFDFDECEDQTATCPSFSTCRNTAGAYECDCDTGYVKVGGQCLDGCTVLYTANKCSKATATCSKPEGTAVCACKFGYKDTSVKQDGSMCVVDDTCTGLVCDERALCDVSDGGMPECRCPEGYSGDGSTCDDINECEDDSFKCDDDADCVNTEGGYACDCRDGFTGDGKTCDDVDECELGTATCDSNATCSNTPAGTYTCACKNGYSGDGKSCADVNECDLGTDNCSSNADCMNTVGSFSCNCKDGYTGNGVTCNDVDECATNNGNCGAGVLCSNSPGSFSCGCPQGERKVGNVCTNINECTEDLDNCSPNATCTDDTTTGAPYFTCACTSGYTGDGVSCVDIDECATNNGGCGNFRSCSNNAGAAPTCTDINECLTNNGGCGSSTYYTCTNNNNAAPTCADINECATNNGGCGSATFYSCTNNAGGPPTCADINECATNNGNCGNATFYSCTNNAGAAPTCADINECATNNGNCGNASFFACTNNVGSGPSCADINECATNNGNCGSSTFWTCTNNNGAAPTCTDKNECALNTDGCDTNPDACVNSQGGFSCICPGGYSGNGMGAGGCLRNECTLNTDDCDDIGVCTDTQDSWTCGCPVGYTGSGVGATGCCTPDGVKTDSGFPNDGIDNDCNGLKDKPVINYASSFPELGGASSGADVSISIASSNVSATTKQVQYRKYKRSAGPGSATFGNCTANPCRPFSNTESASAANDGAWRIELRWAFTVMAGTFYSETETFDTYIHSSMHGATKCTALGVTDAALFAVADTDLKASLVGKTSTGFQMVDPGTFAVGTDTFVTSPFITVGYKPITGAFFDIKRVVVNLAPPTATTTPTYSADMLSLRKRFVVSADGRYILIRRVYASKRGGGCEAARFKIASSDRLYNIANRPASYKPKFIDAKCDAVVLNRAGAGVCLDVNGTAITQTFAQVSALRTNAPSAMYANVLGYGDSNKFMWRQLLEEKDYNALFGFPAAPTHSIFRNFTPKCDTVGCNTSANDSPHELYLPDRAIIRP